MRIKDYPHVYYLKKKWAVMLLLVGVAISIGIATGNLWVGIGVGFGLLTLVGFFLEKKDSEN